MQHETDVMAEDEFLRHGGVDDAHVVAESGSLGFEADGVQLDGSGMIFLAGQGVHDGFEVGWSVPVAWDEDEAWRAHWAF